MQQAWIYCLALRMNCNKNVQALMRMFGEENLNNNLRLSCTLWRGAIVDDCSTGS